MASSRGAIRTHPDPRKGPGFTQTLPTLTTWREVHLGLLAIYPGASGASDAPACDFLAFRRAVRYVFSTQRSAVIACVRAGRIVLAAQIANENFRNAWHRRIDWDSSARTFDRAGAEMAGTCSSSKDPEVGLEAYLQAKVRSGGADERAHILHDPARWWLNGNVVCNVPALNVWGDAFVTDVMAMVARAFEHTHADVDLILNRRDGALLDALDPVARNIARDMRPGGGALSCLSFYTGPAFLDRPMPTTEDWRAAVATPYTTARRPWEDRRRVAVFRGSSTGHANPDLNVRVLLARLSKRHPHLLDAGLTAVNTRDRIVAGSPALVGASASATVASGRADHKIVVSAVPRRLVDHLVVPFMDMQTQFDTYRYVIYAPGHSAASRIGALLASGCAVVYVQDPTCRCPHTWLQAHLRPVRWKPTDRRLGTSAVHPQDANIIVATVGAGDDHDHGHDAGAAEDSVAQAVEWLIHNNAAAKKIRDNARELTARLMTEENVARHVRDVVVGAAT